MYIIYIITVYYIYIIQWCEKYSLRYDSSAILNVIPSVWKTRASNEWSAKSLFFLKINFQCKNTLTRRFKKTGHSEWDGLPCDSLCIVQYIARETVYTNMTVATHYIFRRVSYSINVLKYTYYGQYGSISELYLSSCRRTHESI